MRLSDLVNGDALGPVADREIAGLSADSREIRPGYLFAALAGSRADGASYIADAVRHGAVAVLTAPQVSAEFDAVARLTDENPRRRFALMAARFYREQPGTIAAVTGTNGKTSVANFTRQIWDRLGWRAASLGTLGVLGPDGERPLRHTTPDPVEVHQILAGLARDKVSHLALEASSHGLDQCRLDGVRVSAAAFTNLTRDHFDYHPTAQDYLNAKLRLVNAVMAPGGAVVLNADSDAFEAFRDAALARRHRILTYGRRGKDIRLVSVEAESNGQALRFELMGRVHDVFLPLVGAFQAQNVLCSLGLVVACNADEFSAVAALSGLRGVPGRVALVARHGNGAPVFVDYAHTPDALANVLQALRPHCRGRLVAIFGCGGDRDPGKRPEMGRAVAEHADIAILTDDNPRGEDPAAIRKAAMAGCPQAIEIGDRAEAIRAGIGMLEADDLLVIAGKGHEQGQVVGDKVLPFDDSSVARQVAQALGGSAK
ncbi:UDP-N-acetylmuramoyl-L-alanyl-D-glutamate--2,6-diaminopimelate ligase [Oceanibacterium hippocampi]|uniref:UDP-N-acetylmuramoyl-L-alanyl-D-glutamate--2,6-diaminopimelate ligase n=1 Tax=Oceanibacterium hippocampi TaxID=745714 RepID=A0A1Y5SCE6_9PROT|nr:UDP-N-acetylmuramoyl-L-alanyl-D-glutamate--2,6-diaminopimelate ligase [Oceanibacterium hippocampi]SLN37233.1 UDP-N-acetylmuramoyl-L-alanyl-D-glutamate--2, 6-diaminopimelate ligase [Oceanibacterium hippocampi]